MKKILSVFVVACFAQAAIAAAPGEVIASSDSLKRPAAATRAVSAPVQLTDAEMDKVAGGLMYLYHGIPSGKHSEVKVLFNAGGTKNRTIDSHGVYMIVNP